MNIVTVGITKLYGKLLRIDVVDYDDNTIPATKRENEKRYSLLLFKLCGKKEAPWSVALRASISGPTGASKLV